MVSEIIRGIMLLRLALCGWAVSFFLSAEQRFFRTIPLRNKSVGAFASHRKSEEWHIKIMTPSNRQYLHAQTVERLARLLSPISLSDLFLQMPVQTTVCPLCKSDLKAIQKEHDCTQDSQPKQ